MVLPDRASLEAAAARSFAAAAAFRASEPYRALELLFAEVAIERAISTLLSDHDWVGELIAPLITALAEDPWFEPPFRVARDGLRIGTVLFETPAVSIAATVLSANALATLPPPRTVVVPGRVTVTRYVRAGNARLRLWQAEPIGADFSAATAKPCVALPGRLPTDGAVVRIDGRTHGHILAEASSDVVTLSATLRAQTIPYAREYAIDSGALVRVATNDDRAARTQMLLAYLRLAGRSGSEACFAAATRDPAFFLRWAAMREWLASDTRAALPRLRAMAADDPHAEVRAAAIATLALVEQRLAA
ncbi:HEAT repeat domain-containing protein [Sphingomonas sp.]|uniref:HEAT repeat domain-containing protein n=1 Tax=Sphingomonas sp. TaxID=28214 RepID=UPI00333FA4C7